MPSQLSIVNTWRHCLTYKQCQAYSHGALDFQRLDRWMTVQYDNFDNYMHTRRVHVYFDLSEVTTLFADVWCLNWFCPWASLWLGSIGAPYMYMQRYTRNWWFGIAILYIDVYVCFLIPHYSSPPGSTLHTTILGRFSCSGLCEFIFSVARTVVFSPLFGGQSFCGPERILSILLWRIGGDYL